MAHYSRLDQSSAAFDRMIQRFGVVTVMDVKIFNASDVAQEIKEGTTILSDTNATACDVARACLALDAENKTVCSLNTLKVANITQEGPTKTVTGGQNASPLLKFGKTARLEMQDALGNNEALEALCGTITEYLGEPIVGDASQKFVNRFAVHAGDEFGGPKTILGKSFFIEQESGAQVPVYVLVYQFLPDSVFNLTQDAEGDATVFDLNGDLISTKVVLGDNQGRPIEKNIFYSILDPQAIDPTGEHFAHTEPNNE